MKILFIPEFSESGGTKVFFNSLIDYYKKNDKVDCVLYTEKTNEKYVNLLLKQKNISKSYSYKQRPRIFDYFPFSLIWEFFNLRPLIRKVNPDFIFVSNQKFGLMLYTLCTNKKVIYLCHTYPESINIISRKSLSLFLNSHLSKNKILVSVSSYSSSQIKKIFNLRKKVGIIYNTAIFSKNNDIKKHKGVLILTVANVEEYKNPQTWLDTAIRVVNQNKQIKFMWVGGGSVLKKYRNKIPQELKKNINFVGNKKHLNAMKYYSQSDIYFQPSLKESHGISILEAMANGMPCVVSDVGGIPESVANNSNGFVIQGQKVTEYSRLIIELANKQKLRKKMGERGMEIFNKKFSYKIWESNVNKIHNI